MQFVTPIKTHGPVVMHTAVWVVMLSPFDRAGPRLVEWVVTLLKKQLSPVEDHSHRFLLIG